MIWEIDEQVQAVEGVDPAGRPDPAYAAALGLLRAPFGRRALSFTCDIAIWVVLQLPLWLGAVPLLLKFATGSISSYGFVNHPDFVLGVVMAAVSMVLSLAFVVIQLVLHGRRGLTVGKAITGIRTVNVRTLERPGLGRVLLRYLIVMAAGILPLAGSTLILLTPMLDPERRGRGWHDRATGAWLIDARHGLNPYDEKRMRIARKMAKADPLPDRSELPSLATRRDPSAQPEYRPGGRISAGVLGVSRPEDAQGVPVGSVPAAPTERPLRPESQPPVPPQVTPAVRAAPIPAPVIPRPAPAAPSPAPAAPAPRQEMRFALRFETGDSIPVFEPILLGRDPASADHPGSRAIAVADESRSLSKTHLLVRPVEGGLEIIDWHSTNGSGLISGGTELALSPGVPVPAVDGDRIRLGDRVADVIRI